MKHRELTDQERERAALYALGALAPADATDFEAHLRDGCTVCTAEVSAFGAVAHDLALAAHPVPPPARVREQVLDRVGQPATAGFHFQPAREAQWHVVEPGIARRDLGPSTFLIRMEAGSRVARHHHAAVEHCYVLEGDLRVAGRHLGAGDYHEAAAGSVHEGLTTDHGCLLLIVESGALGA